jgi:aminoglycoside phosphotransferase (APT) family kinase protein
VSDWKPYLDAVEPMCFLDDLTVKNVIIQNGEFQGIVDLDLVCYGDPLYWLSLAEVTVVLDVGTQGSFYGDELRRLWGMTAETSTACDLYNVIQSWFFLSNDDSNRAVRELAATRLARINGC